jgi:Mycotoxin biosynthesis protein UstYa
MSSFRYHSVATDDEHKSKSDDGFRPKQRRKYNCSTVWGGLLIVGLSAVILVNFYVQMTSPMVCTYRQTKYHQVFNSTPEYESFDRSKDHLWEELLSSNGGFLVREMNGEKHLFGITMFHQLHCLQMIRMAIQNLTLGPSTNSSHNGHSLKIRHGEPGEMDKEMDENGPQHWQHCFDYLRQVRLWSLI